jgi:hypothetical protein
MNLLMTAPLCDSRGKIRYFIGAQVDVSGLVKECSDLESFRRIVEASDVDKDEAADVQDEIKKDEFQELSEMLNMQELDTVRKWGGRMHRESKEETQEGAGGTNWNKPRLLIHSDGGSPDGTTTFERFGRPTDGRLSGVYEHYLLVRPYPSLRILFASPTLRVPGILQSPFMSKIGGSSRVREELTQALADGRGVTAKVRWVSKLDTEGRSRWIHCTPLIGSNGAIGVWMVILVDDEREKPVVGRFRQAPPIDNRIGRNGPSKKMSTASLRDTDSLRAFALDNGGLDSPSFGPPARHLGRETAMSMRSDARSGSPYTLNLG